MAVLYITEFNSIGGTGSFPVSGASQPPVAEQTVGISGSSAPSNAFNKNTLYVRLHTDAICSIEFSTPTQIASGTSPTASTSTARMAANQTEYFNVVPGQKVAVISNS